MALTLLVDMIMATRRADGHNRHIPVRSTCKDCGTNPLSGVRETLETPEFGGGTGQGTNFWVRKNICYECSVFYPKRELFLPPLTNAAVDIS